MAVPIKTELILKFDFEASHSLAHYEVPHPHLWKLTVCISGTPINGMIIDIVRLREGIESILIKVKQTYLNENPHTPESVRQSPTCETLSQFFVSEIQRMIAHSFINENPSVNLSSVSVAICAMDGAELGAVKLSLS